MDQMYFFMLFHISYSQQAQFQYFFHAPPISAQKATKNVILYRNDRAFDSCEVKMDANRWEPKDSDSLSHAPPLIGFICKNPTQTHKMAQICFQPILNCIGSATPTCCLASPKTTLFAKNLGISPKQRLI